jgi:hypothetical protein
MPYLSTAAVRRPTFGLHPAQKISSIVGTRVTGRRSLLGARASMLIFRLYLNENERIRANALPIVKSSA